MWSAAGGFAFTLAPLGLIAVLARRRAVVSGPAGDATDALEREITLAKDERDMERDSVSDAKKMMLNLADSLDNEVQGSVTEVIGQSEEMGGLAQKLAALIDEVNQQSTNVSAASEQAAANVQAVAGAAEELAASGHEIGQRVSRSTTMARNAVAEAERATETVRGLATASATIDEVVKLINNIAGQTNLLALNATIEAARAGEAGKGFAVVASEVKNLANQTARATEDIKKQIQGIQEATGQAVDAITSIGRTINEINGISSEVADAVAQQGGATTEISRNSQQAAALASEVTANIGNISSATAMATQHSNVVQRTAANTTNRLRELQRRLTTILRESASGNRRGHNRLPVDIKAQIRGSGRQFECHVHDLSPSGALCWTGDAVGGPGSAVELEMPEIGRIPALVVEHDHKRLRVKFNNPPPEIASAIEKLLAARQAIDDPFIKATKASAGRISELLEQAVAKNEISLKDLFDEEYEQVLDSNPVQYLTKFVSLTDRILPPIQEPMLQFDAKVAFCAAVDRNGFLPTHNNQYSKPQGKDAAWNVANCRNRRIFDDRTGLAASHNINEYLLQTYQRDMGGGNMVMMKDLSVPIFVRGRHWGGLRLGYRL